MRILVTGGAGFIGSAVVRYLIRETGHVVINVDKLTYAGHLSTVETVMDSDRYHFEKRDICDVPAMESVFDHYQPDGVMHLAAESHVDRSIDGPAAFMQTNIIGTYELLEVSRAYWDGLDRKRKKTFVFHHISTDEVFGSLGSEGLFSESTPYRPNSPYSSSKASSDHLVRAWHHTYGLPVVVTNCSNNYGPYQFPEKLIPLMITKALNGEALPVYGKGDNVRDWLYVEDHARALLRAFQQGVPGQTYNIGGNNEETNLKVVVTICDMLDDIAPGLSSGPRRKLITFVEDRPGHDHRYAIDASKIATELHWTPAESFESGLSKTLHWYLENQEWVRRVQGDDYRGQRLGRAGN